MNNITELFSRTYYGNTVSQWLTTLLLILAAVIFSRVLYLVLAKSIKRLARKSHIRVDDILIDAIEEPLVVILALLGSRASLARLVMSEQMSGFLDGAFGLAYSLLTAWLLTRLYDALHRAYIIPFVKRTHGLLDDQISPLLRNGLRIIIWVLAIIIGLYNAGYNVGTVLAGLGIGGLAFALAAQDTVANIFGGITIFAQKPFQIGDLIEFEGKQMTVNEIGWRATTLKDWNTGYRITIPNSKFTGGIIANVSAEAGYWWANTLKLAPDTRAALMEQTLQDIREIVTTHPDVDKHLLRFETLGNYTLDILLIYHIKAFDDRWRVITDVSLELLRRFEQRGIRLAAPIQVNLTGSNGAAPSGTALPHTPAATGVAMFVEGHD